MQTVVKVHGRVREHLYSVIVLQKLVLEHLKLELLSDKLVLDFFLALLDGFVLDLGLLELFGELDFFKFFLFILLFVGHRGYNLLYKTFEFRLYSHLPYFPIVLVNTEPVRSWSLEVLCIWKERRDLDAGESNDVVTDVVLVIDVKPHVVVDVLDVNAEPAFLPDWLGALASSNLGGEDKLAKRNLHIRIHFCEEIMVCVKLALSDVELKGALHIVLHF